MKKLDEKIIKYLDKSSLIQYNLGFLDSDFVDSNNGSAIINASKCNDLDIIIRLYKSIILKSLFG